MDNASDGVTGAELRRQGHAHLFIHLLEESCRSFISVGNQSKQLSEKVAEKRKSQSMIQ
jgi:hypothetical protein